MTPPQPKVGTQLILDGWHGRERWTRRRGGWSLAASASWIALSGIPWWALCDRARNMGRELILDGQQTLIPQPIGTE